MLFGTLIFARALPPKASYAGLAPQPEKPYPFVMKLERKPINRLNDALMKYVFADNERKHITLR